MTISRCEFSAPITEGSLADVTLILNGVLVLMDISIIREKNIPLHRDRMSVVFPDTFLFSDDYAERIVESEILVRYGDWLDEQRRLLGRDEDLSML